LIGQLLITGFIIGLVYGVVALGFVLIYKASGIINLAQGQILMVGGFLGWVFFSQFGLPFPLAFILTLVASFLLGVVIERFFIRHLIGEPLLAIIILTLGLSILMSGIAMIIWGHEVHIYPDFDWLRGTISMFGIGIDRKYVFSFAIAVACLFLFASYFRYASSGIMMRAVADDQLAAQSVGIPIRRVLSNIWGIASLTGGVGGIVLGFLVGVTTFGTPAVGLKVLPIVILGGLESLPGAICGGIIVGIAEMICGFYLDPIVGGGTKDLIPFVLMLGILLFRPYGIFGLVRIERV